MQVARVLVESAVPRLDRLLDYAIPARLADDIVIGGRVRVPLGRGGRLVDGYVIECASDASAGITLSEIDTVIGTIPVVTPSLWQMVRLLADRNGGSASDILRIAVPKRAVRVEKNYAITARPEPKPAPGSITSRALAAGVVDTPQGVTLRSFAEIADVVRQSSGGVIVVVPDWRDLELLSRALHDMPHTVWTSTGTPSERYERYLRVLNGDSTVVIGTRSVIYAPVVNLATIVVVNESDPLLDEPLAPFVHVRDAAIVRHGIDGGDLVFAAQTPSVEIERFVDLGFAQPVSQRPQRPTSVLANDPAGDGFAGKARIPASAWRLMRDALEVGPALVQVARPGFVPSVVCASCRTAHRCVRCRSLLAGAADGSTVCRVCGAHPVGIECRHCGGRDLAFAGVGSIRTADELGRAFAGVKVVVADAEHRHLEIPRGKTLVVATRGAEPIVSGGYEAVLIIDGDRELQRPGLRTTENCLRWWGSAAALCSPTGITILANIDGAFGASFVSGEWETLVQSELRDRRALGFPPAVRSIAVTGNINELAVVRSLPELAAHRIVGPAPTGVSHRIVILVDYAGASSVVAAIRAHVVAKSNSTIRIHCDDLSVFDDVDED